MKLKLSEFFIALIVEKAFYGRLATSLQRVAKPGMGTMAVGIRDGRATFFYDPTFVEKLSVNAAMFVLEHEMLHLVLDHIPRYLELLAACRDDVERLKAAKVYNVAMDASINTMLRGHKGFQEAEDFTRELMRADHPENPGIADFPHNGMVLPEKFELPLDGSFEFYQWSLMRRVNVIEVILQGSFGPGTHDLWTQGDEKGEGQGEGGGAGQGSGQGQGGGKDLIFDGSTFKDMSPDELLSQAHRIRAQVKEALRSVVRSMGGVGRGTLPGGIEEWLNAYLADPIIPWWEVFSTRAKMSRTSKFDRSVTVPNRALLALSEEDINIIPAPGRVRDKAWRIFLYVDTSGSMDTESLEIVKSELGHMLAVDDAMEIRYMQGDATTHLDVVLKTGDAIPQQMVGRGGTDFDAYFIHMKQYVGHDQKSPDLVVVYTDGYAPPVAPQNRLPPDIPVVWLVTPGHSDRFAEGYGEVIVCDPSHNNLYDKGKKAA